MSNRYLVIQTDVDDYYVECPTQEFFDRLCKCVPHTSEFRSWHSSDTPEGTELNSKGSMEIFGRDIISIAKGSAEAPWNADKFRERLKKSVGSEYVCSGTANVILTTQKSLQPHERTPENSIIVGMTNCAFFANDYQNPIPWIRMTDGEANKIIQSAVKWLKNHNVTIKGRSGMPEESVLSPSLILPRSDVPTYKELAMWLAEGRGELLDLNNFNTVKHTLDYPLDKENECLHPLDVCYYRVRVKDDITWRKPDIKSMGIQRWDIAKFSVYIASKYEDYVKLSVGLLGPDLYLGNLRLANFATGAVTEIGKSLGELTALTTVPWDKLTDKDVMLLEKDMERIIEEGIPNE